MTETQIQNKLDGAYVERVNHLASLEKVKDFASVPGFKERFDYAIEVSNANVDYWEKKMKSLS